MTPVFHAVKDKGRFLVTEREKLEQYKQGLNDGDYEVVIRKPKKTKSRPYEKYYWPICVKLWSAHYGETIKSAHEMLLLECAPRVDGEILRSSDPRFTLDIQLKFVEDVRMFMAREGCPTPDPNQVEI